MQEEFAIMRNSNSNNRNNKNNNSTNNNGNYHRRSYRCKKCTDENVFKCSHCFKCGNEGHQSRNCTKKRGKLEEVGRRETTCNLKVNPSQTCNSCGATELKMKQCNGCEAVTYCGSKCQRKHWKLHRLLCCSIQKLAQHQEIRTTCEAGKRTDRHQKIIQLVGKRC